MVYDVTPSIYISTHKIASALYDEDASFFRAALADFTNDLKLFGSLTKQFPPGTVLDSNTIMNAYCKT